MQRRQNLLTRFQDDRIQRRRRRCRRSRRGGVTRRRRRHRFDDGHVGMDVALQRNVLEG